MKEERSKRKVERVDEAEAPRQERCKRRVGEGANSSSSKDPMKPEDTEMEVEAAGGAAPMKKRTREEGEGTERETRPRSQEAQPVDQDVVMRVEEAIASLMERFGTDRADVAEIYSQPRVTREAQYMGLTPGFALDLTTCDDDGRPWDFADPEMRQRARHKLKQTKPRLLIGSPMCRAFSSLMVMSAGKRDPEVMRREFVEATVHLEFCIEMYEEQLAGDRYFLHEHPRNATSWKNRQMEALMGKPGVLRLVGHMCRHGMQAEDAQGKALVLKPTGWLTNCPGVAKEVAKKCSNLNKWGKQHRHVELVGGKAKQCEVYPRRLCQAILKGLRNQLIKDGRMEVNGVGIICQEPEEDGYHPHEDEGIEKKDAVYDEITGMMLDDERVKAARNLELEFIDKKPLYEMRPTEEAVRVTGKPPISTRWVDINKGDVDNPDYRSRWVARQFKDNDTTEFFAATPPWEAIKMMISLAASQGRYAKEKERKGEGGRAKRGVSNEKHWVSNRKGKSALKLDLLDISRAHFNAKPKDPTYVKLPPGREIEGMCAKLIFNLYGTRGAAQAWEDHYSGKMISWGFTAGKGCPCVFEHPEMELLVVVHGDDFTSLGTDESLDWLHEKLSQEYEFKCKGRLGPGEGDAKEVRLLNRIITWTDEGIEIEADQRHVDIAIKQLGLEKAKAVSTAGVKEKEEEEGDGEELEREEARLYRGVAARFNFLSIDRPEIQYATKEACRAMAKPTRAAWRKVKRIGRYLKGRPRAIQVFKFQSLPHKIVVAVDSDYAGCKQTRKSTSGGCVKFGSHVLRTWSSTQAVISLSSGEAEYYAMLKGASVGLGIESLAGDYGLQSRIVLETDSSAAKGIAGRKGLGKTRHIEVCHLWLQEKARNGDVEVVKIAGDRNIADLQTKYLTEDKVNMFMKMLGYKFSEGQHRLALSSRASAA